MSKKKTDSLEEISSQLLSEPIDLKVSKIGTKEYFDDCAEMFQIKITEVLVSSRMMSSADEFALDGLVRTYRSLIEYNYHLRIEPPIVEAAHGPKANPLVQMVQSQEKIYLDYLTKFGLTPKSRNNQPAYDNKPAHGNSNRSKNKQLRLINGN